ncbi:CoA transferase [Nocardia colli]|uniref:CoA transferase n=1 Tax=Nocardia colli TaxID=2545717 RepID=A0A5N0DMP1_9NOCA|nr:CoA transferase [Nocardia colli]KAA8877304.1 CoA transferase [Nocardia colli]
MARQGRTYAMKQLPLKGIRVLDLTMMWAGPYATKMLGEMGADVIKIESAGAWDNVRTLFPSTDQVDDPWNANYYFSEYNHEKRSVTLDLRREAGRQAFLRLARNSDVVIDNYRADVMDKLGLSPEVLLETNPRLVIVSMAAFGKHGADSNLVGFGPIFEMMSGLTSLSGYDSDTPQRSGVSYGDPIGGLTAVGAVTLSLLNRERTGSGSVIDLSQNEACAAMAGAAFAAYAASGFVETPTGNRNRAWAPEGCYPARGDDQWIVLSCTNDAEWAVCAALTGHADLGVLTLEERRTRHDEIDELIAAWSSRIDPRVAVEALQAAGVPAGRVLDMRTIKDDPHLYARGFWIRVPNEKMRPYRKHGVVWRFREANPTIARHAPYFGADNREVLSSVGGMTPAEIDQLEADGVISVDLGSR